MPKLVQKVTGVRIEVPEDIAATLDASWVPEKEPTPKKRGEK